MPNKTLVKFLKNFKHQFFDEISSGVMLFLCCKPQIFFGFEAFTFSIERTRCRDDHSDESSSKNDEDILSSVVAQNEDRITSSQPNVVKQRLCDLSDQKCHVLKTELFIITCVNLKPKTWCINCEKSNFAYTAIVNLHKNKKATPVRLERTIFWSEVRRLIH